jgi:hypothetical protein
METVYLVCAAVGGTLIICQFLVTLLGLGGHHDVGGHDVGGHDFGGHDFGGHDVGGHDVGGHAGSGHAAAAHHETGHQGSGPTWFLQLLTFRTLTAASAFFGLAGLACIRLEIEPLPGLVIALAAGGLALVVVGWIMQLLSRLNIDGTVRIERAVGSRGTVYLSVPGARAGVGKVHVNQLNRTIEYKAITAQDHLPTGAKIVVVGIVSADTVEVAPASESERTAHA